MKNILMVALGFLTFTQADAAELFTCKIPSTGFALSVDVTDIDGRLSDVTVSIESTSGNSSFKQAVLLEDWQPQLDRGTIIQMFPTGEEGVVNSVYLSTALLALTRGNDNVWTGSFSNEKGGVVPFLTCAKVN